MFGIPHFIDSKHILGKNANFLLMRHRRDSIYLFPIVATRVLTQELRGECGAGGTPWRRT